MKEELYSLLDEALSGNVARLQEWLENNIKDDRNAVLSNEEIKDVASRWYRDKYEKLKNSKSKDVDHFNEVNRSLYILDILLQAIES